MKAGISKKASEIPYALQESDENYLVEEITRQKVDLPAANDRAGLATYFKFHSSDYRWESPGIEESCFIALIKRRQSKPKNAEESAGKRVGGQASANF